MRVKLGDICIINPKAPKCDEALRVSFIPMPKVGENGEFDPSDVREYNEVKKGFTYFENNDVLFAKITPCMENGKGAIAANLENGVGFGSTEFHVLRPKHEYVTSKWLYYLLSWSVFRKEAEKNMTGSAGQKRVPKSFLDSYVVDLPMIAQQQRVTATLDRVNSLISLKKQQLAKLDELVKSRFIEMFGDPEDSTTKWERTTFSSVCIDMHQGINTVADKVEYVNSGFPIIQSKNITSGYLDLEDVRYVTESDYEYYRNKYNPKPSDLLVCNIGTIGKSLIVKNEVDFLIAWNLFLIKLNKELVNPIFIKVFIELLNQQNYFEKFMTGGTVKFVNKKTMGNISTPIPPMALQEQFATFVEQTDKSKFEIQKSLEKLETLKKALMQEYFG